MPEGPWDLPRYPWAVAGPGRASRRGESSSAQQAPLVWRAPEGPEGQAAVLVGGGGARPRCWSAAAGPGCGARGRRRGLAGLRADAPSEARGADGERAGRRPRAHKVARPDSTPAAPGTPAAQEATKVGSRRRPAHTAARPRHAETPPRGCGTGFSLPSRV